MAKRRTKTKATVTKRKSKPAAARTKTKRAKAKGTTRSLISASHKTALIAAEPPINANLADLTQDFRQQLQATLDELAAGGVPFRFVEGFRTVERQQWLYGSGRPQAPYGRPGPIVTRVDGVNTKSNHQGDGSAGSGRAADCYPTRDGKVFIPGDTDPVWERYAREAESHGLTAGYHWTSFKDAPHCELHG